MGNPNDYHKRSADYLIQSIRDTQMSNNTDTKSSKNKVKFPCSICNFDVKNNDKSIQCTTCEFWVHIRCNGISVDEYKERQKRNRGNPELIDGELWSCMKCVLNSRSDIVPFIFSSETEIHNLNSLDSMKLIDSLPSEDVHQDALHTNQLGLNDELDESNF